MEDKELAINMGNPGLRIDFDKVKSIEDVVEILKLVGFQFQGIQYENHPLLTDKSIEDQPKE